LQVDPSFTYAHTLSGHEAVNNEDLEKATQSFNHALARDDRHYNAWYGLGAIAYRQERLDEAEHNFRKALEINSSSSVLRCYLGMVLHAQGGVENVRAALAVLTHACSVDVNNPQLHFQRAHVLIATRRYEEALRALELVRQQAPREPPVHILMGRVSRKLGRVQDALKHFSAAIDLDPKESASLKAEIEHLDEPDEDEDDEDEEEADELGSDVSGGGEFV
jgi:anaphase-promoting complex subunit 3